MPPFAPLLPGWRVVGGAHGSGGGGGTGSGDGYPASRIYCRNPACTLAAAGKAHIEYRGPQSMHIACKCCGWNFMGLEPPQQPQQQTSKKKKKKRHSSNSVPVVSGNSTPGLSSGKASGKVSGRGTPKGAGKGKGTGHASPHPDSGLAAEVQELRDRLDQALKALADPTVPKEEVAPILAPPKPKPTVNAAKTKVAHLEKVVVDKARKVTRLTEQLEQAMRDHAAAQTQLADAIAEKDALCLEEMSTPVAAPSTFSAEAAIQGMQLQAPAERDEQIRILLEYFHTTKIGSERVDSKKAKCEANVPSGGSAGVSESSVPPPSCPPASSNGPTSTENTGEKDVPASKDSCAAAVPVPETANVEQQSPDKADIDMADALDASKKRGHEQVDSTEVQSLLDRAKSAVSGYHTPTGAGTPCG